MTYGRKKAARMRAILLTANMLIGLTGGVLGAAIVSHSQGPSFTSRVSILVAALAVITAGLALGTSRASRIRVTVGADGVRFQSAFVKQFAAYDQIKEIRHEGDDVIISLYDFTTHELSGQKDAARLADVLERAVAAYRANQEHGSPRLGRKGRPLGQWMQDARALAEQNADYRHATMPEEQLWRIVEDASAEPTERAGAALALRLDSAGKMRLRVAANACAENRLRVALGAVADDNSMLETAFAALEDRRDSLALRQVTP
jgi:hypothetical protein